MSAIEKAVAEVVREAMNGSRKATKIISPALTVKASRRHRPRQRERIVEILLTIGRPNYEEREFIALAKEAGEPFPVRKVQLKPWPKRKS